jgi:hypothetical protein
MALFRRREDVEITLRLPTLESLFVAPGVSPFSPEYETYGDRPGIDIIASRLRSERVRSRVRATVELPSAAIEPTLERRAADAVRRYCRVQTDDLSRDVHDVTRHGIRALLVGLLAVLVLNGAAKPLESSGDFLLEVFAEGLGVTAWVILWVPIGLLIYDRWYYTRDRKIYRRMEQMEISVVPWRDD